MTEPLRRNSFAVTLTVSGGFSEQQVSDISAYCRAISDYLVLTHELHRSGDPHLHMSIALSVKATSAVTLRFARLYEKLGIPYQKGVSVVVKKVNDQTGWFSYISKDVPDGQAPLVCVGYVWGEIQEQCRAAVKKISAKSLKGEDLVMNMSTAPSRIIAFAQRTGTSITGKDSFCDIMAKMMVDGYLVHRLKPVVLYAQVLAKLGYERVAFDYWENELRFS